jgi:hypothetical protein
MPAWSAHDELDAFDLDSLLISERWHRWRLRHCWRCRGRIAAPELPIARVVLEQPAQAAAGFR